MISADSPFDLSIVVPVYRSASILPLLVQSIGELIATGQVGERTELILINDASPDHSWQVIRELALRHPFVRGISLRRNAGQHNAIMAGLNRSRGRVVITMDDDMQHPPQAIPAMIEALSGGFDVCYTNYVNRQHAAWKKVGSWFNDRTASLLLRKPKGLYLSSFKAMTRGVVDEIIKYDGPYVYVDGLILDVTQSVTTVDIQHQERQDGKGNYNLKRSISLWMQMATSFSVFPLRLASVTGALIAALSLIMVIAVIITKITHPHIPAGWASLIATVLFMGGIQLLFIGILGEYIGRTYLKANRKPQFVIAEDTIAAT